MNSKNVRKTPEEESIRKGPASLLKISLWEFSVSACANQPPSYSVSGTSTPNGLSQTINGLKRLVSLLQTAPSTFLNFLLTFFLLRRSLIIHVRKNFAIYHDINGEFNKFFSSSFSSTYPAIRMPKWVHVWPQLDNEVSTWFP